MQMMKPMTGRRRLRAGASGLVAVATSLGLLGVGGPAAAVTSPEPTGASRLGGGWSADEWPAGAGTTVKSVRSIIKADSGAAASLTGQGVGIALIDTGVAPVAGLPAAQVVNGPDLSFESQSGQLRYLDTFGHGTHMAGIMVGNDAASGTIGLAPKAKVTSVKVGTATGANDVSQMIAAIDWVVQNRNHDPASPIRVLNLSYGTSGMSASTVDPLMYAVEQAWQAGIVVVVAAGNDGNTTTALTNPAMDPFVLAVGASTTNNTIATTDDDLATYTNNSNATRKVDILAPGTSIVSLRDPGSNIDQQYASARVGDTGFKGSGTSQAAAVTASAVALLLQQRPSLTPDQVKKLLTSTATTLTTGTAAAKGLKELNVSAAVAAATPSATQSLTKGTGTGSLETTRGGNHLSFNNIELKGEQSIFGPFNGTAWANLAAQKTSWNGGMWMGYRMAGDTWTGAGGTGGTGQVTGYAGKCIDVQNRQSINGTPVQLYDCNNTPAQYWVLAADGSAQALGKCLDVTGAGTVNGTKVQLYDCNGTPAQQWRVNTARQLVNVNASKCLDVTEWNSANGTQLQIWDCGDQDNQRWVPPSTSRTWAAASWQGSPWTGTGSWSDPEWSEQYWTGHYWSGHYWSGHYWSADDWATSSWS
ncbi:S8 family serine peptidase [Dactylosporangium sp. NPDC049742]|uniref:S8 family serine peptidase n=1 Tax=Dactylosporangium sp. NPDC049742 TaxID=3154737 RepID=UPI0034459289